MNGKGLLRALIIDGQNNHGVWPKSTVMMKQYLEETGLFTVDVERTAFTWKGDDLIKEYPLKGGKTTEACDEPRADPDFKPAFTKYGVVVSNLGWGAAPWPRETRESFESFVSEGGGLVIVHAADNSFGEWTEFNKMIGIGGWGDRTEKHGPYVYFDDAGSLIRDDSPGKAGSHGRQHEFQITMRDESHPITTGMPRQWRHTKDELYDKMRGPAENMHILATTYSDLRMGGTGRHEPMLLTVTYGKGRVFHTLMGHEDYSFECVGFISTFQRGTEWAATGAVTQPVPEDFPTADEVSARSFQVVE